MVKKHLKSIPAPKTIRILRKETVYVVRPYPGASKMDLGLPLNYVIKEFLSLALTTSETKKILHDHEVKIDGKRSTEYKSLVGLFSTVEVPALSKAVRITFDETGRLSFVDIDMSEANLKICKINNKSVLKGNKLCLHLSDGRNILNPEKSYAVGDTLLISVPEQEIKEHIIFEKGNTAMVYGGKHLGQVGTIEEIKGDIVSIKTHNDAFDTDIKNIFIVGKNKPVVRIR